MSLNADDMKQLTPYNVPGYRKGMDWTKVTSDIQPEIDQLIVCYRKRDGEIFYKRYEDGLFNREEIDYWMRVPPIRYERV